MRGCHLKMMVVILVTLLFMGFVLGETPVTVPNFYAVVVGVSQYQGNIPGLSYAGADACRIAQALNLGATRLFGMEKVHVTLLANEKDEKAISPTKKNIKNAFGTIAKVAHPEDIVLIYFAGHGITLQQNQDIYCFVTSEARSMSDLTDPGLRNLSSITSDELQQWLNNIAAKKQVIILDTCAAGAIFGGLNDTRDILGDQQRAIARLSSRRGLHILMGCAADAKSFETNQYGHGLLTYALLRGIKGAALRQDQFIDIHTLFSYAADAVPALAKKVGGIQRPLISISPGGSFDIGMLTVDDRQQIPLAAPLPVVLRPVIINPDVIGDPMHISRLMLQKLRDTANTIESTPYLFLDSTDYPGGIILKGLYTVNDKQIQAKIKLWRDGNEVGTYVVSADVAKPEVLCDNIMSAFIKELSVKKD